jgi:GTP-binding protein SAR1
MIDVSDKKRFQESKIELDLLMKSQDVNCPILILGNKIDKIGAASRVELNNYFEISKKKNNRKLEYFLCSVLKKNGYEEAFKWYK